MLRMRAISPRFITDAATARGGRTATPATTLRRGTGKLRAMYLVNLVGAGGFGLATVAAPRWMAENFYAAPQDPVMLGMLGAIWFAIGGTSVFGLRALLKFAGIFPVQAAYKAVWLATAAAPAVLSGERQRDILPLAILFGLWVAGDLAATPFDYLFGDDKDAETVGVA